MSTERGPALDVAAALADAPALRDLDGRGLAELAAAAEVRRLARGEALYHAGDAADALCLLASGSVELSGVRRGDEAESPLRVARRGEIVGEEATLGDVVRQLSAVAQESSHVVMLPANVFVRAAERGGGGSGAERLLRRVRRDATRDRLRLLALARDLGAAEVDALLDAARAVRARRGEVLYRAGDPADAFFLLLDGLVQLQVEDGDRVGVRAYLGRGDFFGDEEVLAGGVRPVTAVASGPSHLLAVPAATLRDLARRHPALLPGLRRIAVDHEAHQAKVIGEAASHTTRHVFQDLYRMQVARSLLVIDQESCVRCGHCAWSCAELHGTSRLVRRGDKVLARAAPLAGEDARSLLLPNSCQHCEQPTCMLDCPTGAIGRDPHGEVFIRAELCTGCGQCARACPWDNIRMAPRPVGERFAEVAVKCDLCREHEGPACVESCPTGSLLRLHPAEDVSELRALLERAPRETSPATPGTGIRPGLPAAPLAGGVALASLLSGLALAGRHGPEGLAPGRGVGLAAGVLGAALLLALALYAAPKRLRGAWLRRRGKRASTARDPGARREGAAPAHTVSRLRPQLALHLLLGAASLGAVLAHTGGRFGASAAGALHALFWVTAALGALACACYGVLPARLTRLERTGALPEDLAEAERALHDRLYREVSGRSELVKAIFDRVILPYARSRSGPLLLLLSGRGLRDEERRLRAGIEALLEGRGGGKLDGLDELIRTVVELRAVPAQRALGGLLRFFAPAHSLVAPLLVAALLVHVVGVWVLR